MHLASFASLASLHEDLPDDANDVLIVGDSQAGGGLGRALEESLEELGMEVSRYSRAGNSTEQIYQFMISSSFEEDLSEFEYVFIMTGGNDYNYQMLDNQVEIINLLIDSGVDKIYYLGPPDPTYIGSVRTASRIYSCCVTEDTPISYWFDSGRASRRNNYRERLMYNAFSNGAYPIDFMYLSELFGYHIPRYADGIHIPHSVGEDFSDMLLDNVRRNLL